MLYRAEVKLLENMAVFIANVRHNYHINHMVDDAILMSMDDVSIEMKAHGMKLYEVITSNYIKDDVIKYNTTTHNKYLKMFLSLCISVIEHKDKKVNGQLLFTANLYNLKREINIEVLKQKKLRYLFSGVSFVTIAVCVPLNAIREFGISMMPELVEVYDGKIGVIYVAVTLFVTVLIYMLNNRLRESKRRLPKDYRYLHKLEQFPPIKKALDNYIEKKYGKILVMQELLKRIGESISPRQLLLQRLLIAAISFVITLSLVNFMHLNSRYMIIHDADNITSISSTLNSNQVEIIKEEIVKQVNTLKDQDDITPEFVFDLISKENLFYNTSINEEIAIEVSERVIKYQNEYFKWYELIVCLLASMAGYFVPYWMILYRKRVMQMNMEDEVNQFQSIIYMLMYIDHITVKDLLEELELFSIVFKKSLQECINNYNSGDIEALEKLKEKETFGPFYRLIDNCIRCDAIPIEKAFDDIASDRENYYERRKQENDISIQKRADIAKPLSFIPTILVMAYLTVPMLIAGWNELQEFAYMMNNI